MTDTNSFSGTKKSNQRPSIQNFLESLNSSYSNAPSPKPDFQGSSPFAEFQRQKEVEKRRLEQFHHARNQEWKGIYSAKQKELEQKIESIRAQLLQLVKKASKLEETHRQVLETPIPEGGIYHLNLLDHIRLLIDLMSADIDSANSWLTSYKQRGKKMGAYWKHADVSGSKYTQSHERQMATSVG